MTDQEIIWLYNRKMNMTISELVAITGKSKKQIKQILMGA